MSTARPQDWAVLQLLRERRAPVSFTDMMGRLGLNPSRRADLRQVLEELEEAGKITRLGGKHWTIPKPKAPGLTGRLEVARGGFGFVRRDPSPADRSGRPPQDIYVAERDLGTALDGDLVSVEITRTEDRGPTGRITGVLERAHEEIVGWYQRTGEATGEVHPRNLRLNRRIRVPLPPDELGIKDFEWVVARITSWTEPPEPLRGKVAERLGAEDDRGIDVLALLRDRGIVAEFPASVEQEAGRITVDWNAEVARRTDFRDHFTVTIDPATAKDFDDALGIQREGDGWRIFVHIADVAHFVHRGTALDNEAVERSTSVYPVDRVVPMLPERLSGDLCSLRPREDRLTMTAEMVVDRAGRVQDARFHESIINSNHRLTYEQAQALLDEEGASPLHDALRLLRECIRTLRRARFKRGALDLDIPELNVIFDDKGRVCDLRFAEHLESHELVEECMLAANEAVARFLTGRSAPMLYRIHEPAEPDRLLRLVPILRAFGIRLDVGKFGDRLTPILLQRAIEEAHKLPAGHIVRRLILRALKRAEYNPQNAGHFGLASECYCHFTSPIRRYPDVIVHRQLKALLNGDSLAYEKSPAGKAEMVRLGRHTSSAERDAQEAEDEARRIKALEFLRGKVGAEFDGYISSLQPWGIIVELLPYHVEGVVPIQDLGGERFEVDEYGLKMTGSRTGRVFRLGHEVQVRILRVEELEQRLQLSMLELPEARPQRHQHQQHHHHRRRR